MKKKMKMSDESKESLDLKQELSKMINSSPMHVPIYYVNYPEDGNILLTMFT